MGASLLRAAPRLVLKYWWQLLLAVGLPVVVAVFIEAWYGYRAELAQVKRTQATQATSLSAAIEASLQREVAYVTRVYRTPWRGDRLQRLADEAEIAMSLFPAIVQVRVASGAHEVLFLSPTETRRIGTPAEVPSGTGPTRTAIHYEMQRLGPREIPTIVASIPHDRAPGEFLELALDLRSVSDLLMISGRRDATVAYVVGVDGHVVAHSDPALALAGKDMRALPHLADAGDNRADVTGTFESMDALQRPVLATVRAIGDTGWRLVLERSLDDVVAPIRYEAWRTLVLIAVALSAAALLAGALARRFARPILALGRDVERIGRGELSHRSDVKTGDEIEALARQVNEMAARLEGYTAGLEQKVTERTAELEAALRSRALFLAAASHDLRQPLYAVALLADTLSSGPLDAGSAEVLAKQREAITVLQSLFDNLLDLSRFDAGEVKPVRRVVYLRELLAPATLQCEVMCAAKGLKFESRIADEWVETDPDLVRRVIGNLLSNSVRYTAHGTVSLHAERDGSHVQVSIADTGPGIRIEDQDRVFDEFVQLDNPSRDRNKGVGLGLSIVKRISEVLAMPIRMDSVVGRGTRFTLRLPRAVPVQAPQERPEPGQAPVPAGLHIWIVDDDPLVRGAMAAQVAAWNGHYQFADDWSGLQGLRQREGRWPDLLLLDDMLHGDAAGSAIARALLDEMPAERIVMVTGNLSARGVEGIRLLRKPLLPGELAQILRDATRAADGPVRTAPGHELAG